ncbi:unnamed protein product [Rotaria socialis]
MHVLTVLTNKLLGPIPRSNIPVTGSHKLDFDINAIRGLIMVRSLTELELDRFMENILLRDKLNNELVEMRNGE